MRSKRTAARSCLFVLLQIFSDLGASLDDDRVPVEISEREVLGKGGFGIVCKGELVPEVGGVCNIIYTYIHVYIFDSARNVFLL